MATASSEPQSLHRTFRLSPLIRLTLLSLYGALMVPLPFLATAVQASIPPLWLWIGIAMGAIALYGALSERVVVNESGIQVTYPIWVPSLFRRGWFVSWQEITALKPKTTGQGGLVYYFLSESGAGFLLPMRIAGFAELVRIVQRQTGIDTTDVRPLAQPWMYLTLLGFTGLLWLMDAWTISTAITLNP
ncbi:MAG: hypothetical protein HC835_16115 [Oscillatoriales cyanobacterium RM2_1_1]|nr:hypothetical protein [Oscillatoriales cyanobacterium SM2_3_0]NJO47017.1 hypothetical protein [Oscillatoriales cyanobacterium RM2_1_1]